MHRFHYKTIIQIAYNRPFLVGLILRLVAMVVLPWLLDESAVKYTDIDYHVFTDAAKYIQQGKSPYQRRTYRYTPYLAWILSFATRNPVGLSLCMSESMNQKTTECIKQTNDELTNRIGVSPDILYRISPIWNIWRHPRYFGRLIFCLSDALCGLLIHRLRHAQRQTRDNHHRIDGKKDRLYDALWWLWNPLPINICTRGSAESFIVLLPVLSSLAIALHPTQDSSYAGKGKRTLWICASLSGILHGLAVHTKLYPIIYTLSFMVYFSCQERTRCPRADEDEYRRTNCSDSKIPFFYWIRTWFFQLLTSGSSLLFLVFSMSTFSLLTLKSIQQYGMIALQEGLLYHFSRLDHRHNYSMYWYWFYLFKARAAKEGPVVNEQTMTWIQKHLWTHGQFIVMSLPQMALILVSSFGLAPYDLSLALFIQTFLFVAQNKVITAQYFTWYLCLLPLCSHRIFATRLSSSPIIKIPWNLSGLFLVFSILHWLGVAFCVEMLGKSLFFYLWIASMLFYLTQIHLATMILRTYSQAKVKLV